MEALNQMCQDSAIIYCLVGIGVMVGYIAVGMVIATCLVSGFEIVMDEIKKRARK